MDIYGVPEGELERRDVKIDPALMPPRLEDKQAWLREQFANYVGHDEVRGQIGTQMKVMDFLVTAAVAGTSCPAIMVPRRAVACCSIACV